MKKTKFIVTIALSLLLATGCSFFNGGGNNDTSSSSSPAESSTVITSYDHSSSSSSSNTGYVPPQKDPITFSYQRLDDGYLLKIDGQYPNSTVTDVIHPEHADEIREISFGENVKHIKEFHLFEGAVRKISFSKNLESITEGFSFRGVKNEFEGFYFAGNCPKIDCLLNDDSWPTHGSYLYYNPETTGWDDFAIQGHILRPTNYVQKTVEDYTLSEWCNLAVEKYNHLAESKYQKMVEYHEEQLFLMPSLTNIDEYNEIKEFAINLTKNCTTEMEKVDKVYRWVSTNIEYVDECKYYSTYQTFIERKGVCNQYAELMRDMLTGIGIVSTSVRCVAIFNAGITSLQTVLFDGAYDEERNHKLVSVVIDGVNNFFDPTWHVDYKTNYSFVASQYLLRSVDCLAIIPDGISPDIFPSGYIGEQGYMAWVNDYLYMFEEGRIGLQNSATFVNNFSVTTTFKFSIDPDEENGHRRGAAFISEFGYINSLAETSYSRSDGATFNFMNLYNFLDHPKECLAALLEQHHIDKIMIYGDYFVSNQEYGTIEFYDGDDEILTIPSSINGLEIKKIEQYAISDNQYVKEIIIEEGIKYLLNASIYNCQNLKKVTIPSTVVGSFDEMVSEFYRLGSDERIPAEWFFVVAKGCLNLEQYIVANNNSYLMSKHNALYSKDGKVLFASPAKNMELDLEGVEYVTHSACEFCSLTNLVIPSSIKVLGGNAFTNSASLKTVTFLGESVRVDTFSVNSIFANCVSLREVRLPAKQEVIAPGMFNNCCMLHEIELPNTVKEIGSWAFMHSGISHINLPSSLQTINDDAFYECLKLYDIDNYSSLNIEIGSDSYGMVAKYAKDISSNCYLINKDDFLFYSDNTTHTLLTYFGAAENHSLTLPRGINGELYKIHELFFDEGGEFGYSSSAGSSSVVWFNLFNSLHDVKKIYIPNGITYESHTFPDTVNVTIID